MQIDLSIDTDAVRHQLITFIQQQVHSAGYEKALLGLSGGMDSALACYLAAEALGPKKVLALRMPYKTSAPDSLEDAQKVIDTLGVNSITFHITRMADALIDEFPDMDRTRMGNIQARMRMVVLYDQSVAFNGLVVGTGNKTEIYLGYSTLFGDSACAFNPLGDLYKTQVRQLSAAMGIPDSIQRKPPSAGLWSGQTDEGELGFTYAEVDQLLHLLVDLKKTPRECIDEGFSSLFVEKVTARLRRYEFKRRLPPVAYLNHKK